MLFRYRVRELRELGWGGSAFRIAWELQRRSGLSAAMDRPLAVDNRMRAAIRQAPALWRRRPLFTSPERVRLAVAPLLDAESTERLRALALAGADGKILHFSNDLRDCNDPIRWHRDPLSGTELDGSLYCATALDRIRIDIKDVWEMARFPHAYAMGRAATLEPALRPRLARALEAQIGGFIDGNPFPLGVHWSSGQEIAFRLFAWTFAIDTLLTDSSVPFLERMAEHVLLSGEHIERHVEYARRAVYNNHLLSDATGLMLVAFLVPGARQSEAFWQHGRALLDEGVARQFYADGGYIQQSHNYHRVALQDLLWACALCRKTNRETPAAWTQALARSVSFLAEQQTSHGRLPNYGSNDGALVSPLTSCDYSDFRPTLQSASVTASSSRSYEPGPWDEETYWFNGELPPLKPQPHKRASVSFGATGEADRTSLSDALSVRPGAGESSGIVSALEKVGDATFSSVFVRAEEGLAGACESGAATISAGAPTTLARLSYAAAIDVGRSAGSFANIA